MTELAIKGHPTRGKEIIEILEMLGGINKYNLRGDTDEWFILNGTQIQRSGRLFDGISFTLEQLKEKYPYKVGDKVFFGDINYIVWEIESMQWMNNEIKYIIKDNNKSRLCDIKAEHLKPYKEETMEEKGDKAKAPDLKGEDYSDKRFGYKIPDGYEFDTVYNGKIILKPIKPQYPKIYEECCQVLMGKTDFQDFELILTRYAITRSEENSISPCPPYISLINNFYKLLICRDAYWKIAGEQMGLDKPWEPDWGENDGGYRYCIRNRSNKIVLSNEWLGENYILSFPTAEMRDEFFENFKELIEECKELL